MNTYFMLLIKETNVIIGVIITILIVLIRELYQFIFNEISKDKLSNKVLINRGNIIFKSLIDNKYSYKKLIKTLSNKGIKDISSVDYSILYNNELLVFKSDIKNYPISLIIDGKIINDNLHCIKKSNSWLNNQIIERNITLSKISYAFYKDNKVYFMLKT